MILSFKQKFKDGKPTYFIEKIWDSLIEEFNDFTQYRPDFIMSYRNKFNNHWDSTERILPKRHTIREDKNGRWKPGMKIHFFIGSRTLFAFLFAPVVECKSVQKIEIYTRDSLHFMKIDGRFLNHLEAENLAINDGFDNVEDFFNWFNDDFEGKIIHWTNLKY